MHFGTASLADVLGPAIDLAEGGFPSTRAAQRRSRKAAERFVERVADVGAIYLPDGQAPPEGTLIRNPDWARTLKGAIDASLREAGQRPRGGHPRRHRLLLPRPGRRAGGRVLVAQCVRRRLRAAHTRPAHRSRTSPTYGAAAPRSRTRSRVDYRGSRSCKCGPWSQGPVFLQQLKLLEGFDLAALGHNSADYLHLVLEASKLAFADRERYYGDPEFVERAAGPAAVRGLRRRAPRADRPRATPAWSCGPAPSPSPPAPASRPLAGRHRRHDPRRRGRPPGQPVRGYAERRLDRLVAGRRGPRLPARHARPDVLPGRAPRQRARPAQAAADDAHALAGAARRASRGWPSGHPAAISRTSGRCNSS